MPGPVRVDALVAEIGSTTTVVSAFVGLAEGAADPPRLVGQGVAPTSVVQGDVGIGFAEARAELEDRIGSVEPALTLATSSAAGGLRMTVHGLTAKMTAMAAREAALGAGGVVEHQTSGRLTDADLTIIDEVAPGLILLAGGVEGGDSEVVLHNARRLAAITARPIVVYGGNSAAAAEARTTLESAGFRVRVTENVYPSVDELDILPARRVIHDAFEEHIIHAPGMERIGEFVSGHILPTPGSVLVASELLAAELGDLVVIDVGGATTDVHSVTDGSAEIAALATEPQPRAKRTVEGDLGTYISARHVVDLMPGEHADFPPAIPTEDEDRDAAARLAHTAAVTAVRRHAGRLVHLYTPRGRQTVARGRDLTACRYVIGTGGALTRLPGGEATLAAVRATPAGGDLLLPPSDAVVVLDRDYVFACCGVLASVFPAERVVALMRVSLGMLAGEEER